jgi:DNA-binding transcriptional regulator YbjK
MTRDQIKKIALQMIKENGLINLTRKGLCIKADIPDGSFHYIMGCTFLQFTKELKNEPIKNSTHVINRNRVNPELRRNQILDVAIKMSKTIGYNKITRDGIAEQAGVSMGLVTRYLGTMKKLRV